MHWTTTRSSLIARLRDPRDEGAWRTFDRLYGEVIVRYAHARGLRLEDAEDVRQIVLMSMVRAMPGFELRRDRGRFRSYLGRVVGNAIHRFRGRAHHAREWLTDDLTRLGGSDDAPELDELWEREWVDHHLRRALETLRGTASERSVQVFTRLIGGETPDAVASAMQMKVDAVHKVQQRMRKRLHDIIGEQMEHERTILERLAQKAS